MNPADHDEIVSQFCAMTRARPDEAQEYLSTNGWDLEAAVTEYYAEQDETAQEGGDALGSAEPATQSSSSTPRESSSSRKQAPKKFATLGDLTSGAGDSSDDEDDESQDFFAGGEKSGLAVQNPDDLKKKIIEKAKRNQLPAGDDTDPRQTNFSGSARTLGGEDTPSRVINAPNAPAQSQIPRRVRRTLHFWADGFSVDDGDLYRSDDPQNAEILNSIRQGRAPLSIMNAQHGQDVDVEIKQHDEKYVRPKPKYKPFAGQGQRLGSPTPGIRTPTASEPTPAPQSSSEPPKTNVDESQPAVTLQIRLGDGTRLTSRFNTSHTIGDVYEFVTAASPQSQTRPWILLTTFPSKELSDRAAVLGDLAEFKRGGVLPSSYITEMPLEGVKNIILVLSGKGGVGKSSVTLQLALALSLQGKSVGILDIDLTGPSIPRLVGLEGAKITQSPRGWIPVSVHDALAAAPAPAGSAVATAAAVDDGPDTNDKVSETGRGNLRCMSLGFLLRDRGDAVIWRGPKKTAMIRQFLSDVFWGETDVLLVDTPPGTSDEHIALAEELLKISTTTPDPSGPSGSGGQLPRLAGAVLVTTPQAIATSDVRKEVNFCVKTGIPTLGVIENMAGYTCPCCGEVSNLFSSGGGEVMAREMGVRFLGRVPVDVSFGGLVEGKMELEDDENGSDEDGDGNGDKMEVVDEEDGRPLVEKYKECWSYGRFEEFARVLVSELN
ncbi:P-loop containing nucleoside triphosphate hydrolase protein [Aspergillus cavernicola]|uniref:P-loop containing nucleoside triphosphate hydrolase protein n=1 Tax=Aspergillus cavernicola TaxID=176166 RepID=A0ABR4IDX6_9EURO